MVKCGICGKKLGPNDPFCSCCGQETPQAGLQKVPVYPVPVQDPKYAPPKNRSNTALAIIFVVLGVIAVIVVASLVPVFSESPSNSDDEVTIVIHDGYVTYSLDSFITAEAGNKYVVYNVTVTNNKSSDLTFSILSFELHTSTGSVCYPSYFTGTPSGGTPEALSAGASYSFALAHEIPIGQYGTQIIYDLVFDHGSATVPL
jgi:hypothetical protein